MKIFTKKINILLFAYLLIGTGFVLFRPVFSDEGYYIWAARNVWHGKLLYVDFVYHQFPLLAFMYAPFSDLGIATYYILRFSSVLSVLGLIILLYKHVLKVTSDYNAAYFAAVLLIFNGMFMDWNSVVKMFAITNLLCYLSFYMVTQLRFDGSARDKLMFLLTGLVSGLCSNTRIVFWSCTAILFLYLCSILYKKPGSVKEKFYYIILFTFGVLISSSVTIYFLVNYTDYFMFGVFKHNFYAQQSVWEDESNTFRWAKFFFIPQNFILFLFMIPGVIRKFEHKALSFLLLAALFVSNAAGYFVNLYMVALTPYIIYIAAVNYKIIHEKLTYKSFKFARFAVIVYILGFFISVPHFRNKLEGKILEPNLLNLQEMINYEKSLKGERIYSSWYIYSLFSDKNSDGINNDFVYGCMIGKPTKEETIKYSIPDSSYISSIIREKYFDVIVLNEYVPYALLEHREMIKAYYRLDRVFGNIKYFVK